MRKKLLCKNEIRRVRHPIYGFPDLNSIEGCFQIMYKNKRLHVQSGCGGGWDHVSVSLKHRCPTWNEMCYIKDIFWEPNETVIQFHPAADVKKNLHKYCLHLWKGNQIITMPPEEFI